MTTQAESDFASDIAEDRCSAAQNARKPYATRLLRAETTANEKRQIPGKRGLNSRAKSREGLLLRTKNGLPKYCAWNGAFVRFRRGDVDLYLTGAPWSDEFMRDYAAALEGVQAPLSTDGVVAKRGTVQPLIGVYLLMFKGAIVYVGSSLHMPKRVAQHRVNGRPFDQVFYIGTTPDEREVLERTLIKAIDPAQNRAHRKAHIDAPSDTAKLSSMGARR
jgi:hypothetical protein